MRNATHGVMRRRSTTGGRRRLGLLMPEGWRRFAWVYVACCVVSLALIMSACGVSPARTSSKPASATATPSDAFPHFADWRTAYLGEDGRIHAVTLDGETDLAGPTLPELTSNGLTFRSAGASPDGHMVAYGPGYLDIVNLSTGRDNAIPAPACGLFWSPDSSQLALDECNGAVAVASVQDGSIHQMQEMPANVVGNVLGWIDSSRLAVTDAQDERLATAPDREQYTTSVSVASLDIATGRVKLLARINNPDLACQQLTVSPDGKYALFSNADCRGLPFTPLVDEIDLTTGAVTPLLGIAQATNANFSSVAWQAGTDRVAATSDSGANGAGQIWLLTLGQDRALPLATPLPVTHDVAGWAPGSNTLVLTTGYQIDIGSGPFTLYALDVGANGQAEAFRSLTGAAMTFPFLGFVRNG